MNIEHGKREWSTDDVEAVRDAVQDIMRTANLSQAEVSRRSTVPAPTLSQFMSGTYEGNRPAIAQKLSKWLDAHNREKEFRLTAPPEPKFVQTRTANKVQSALQHAQLLDDTAVIVGPPGVGKTAAVDHYVVHTPRAYKITASPAVSTPSAVLAAIIDKYSATHSRTERSLSVRSNIVRTFLTRGALLIVDEAQHLSNAALEELRAIHDDKKCGLALVGNPTVLSRLGATARDASYAQLFGRVGWRVILKKGGEADVRAVLETMNVDSKEVLQIAADIAKREDLRVVVKMTRSAMLLASGQNENLEAKHMRAAYRQLAGEATT